MADGAGSRRGADAGVEVGVDGDVGSGGDCIVSAVEVERKKAGVRCEDGGTANGDTGRVSCPVRERLAIIPRCVDFNRVLDSGGGSSGPDVVVGGIRM